jgi:hypothetical protein
MDMNSSRGSRDSCLQLYARKLMRDHAAAEELV